MNRVWNYPVVYYGLLCGEFCGHLYATTSLEDQFVIVEFE